MEPTILLIVLVCVILGGVLASLGVHLLPVGGAPAAMGTATGIATGAIMLMFGSALTGLFTAATVAMFSNSIVLVALSGAVGAMLMVSIIFLFANVTYIFGAGCVPVSGRVAVDPITKELQTPYKTPQTDGHGLPSVCLISGIIGGFIGGFGGAFIYFALINYAKLEYAMAGVLAMGIILANAIIAAYNIRGTIEGFHDPKFRTTPKALLVCFVASLLCGIAIVLALTTGVITGGAV